MRRIVLLLSLLWPAVAPANDWQALDEPGAFAIMRHALAPGTGDPVEFDVTDCSTQRNLDAAGRVQADRIGAAFRARGHRFDVVLTSQWCRCRDTAERLNLAPVQDSPAFNSFFRDMPMRATRTAQALALLADRDDRPFIVTHFVNISALTGHGTASGEVLIVRHAGDRLEVLGSIRIDP